MRVREEERHTINRRDIAGATRETDRRERRRDRGNHLGVPGVPSCGDVAESPPVYVSTFYHSLLEGEGERRKGEKERRTEKENEDKERERDRKRKKRRAGRRRDGEKERDEIEKEEGRERILETAPQALPEQSKSMILSSWGKLMGKGFRILL